MFNLPGFYLVFILLHNLLEYSLGDNIRLARLVAFDLTSNRTLRAIRWSAPIQPTPLRTLATVSLTLTGFPSDEVISSDTTNLPPNPAVNYLIQPILSPTRQPEHSGSLVDSITFDKISLDGIRISDDGELEVRALNEIQLPAVEFCGQVYLVVVLMQSSGLSAVPLGSLSLPLIMACVNETGFDLAVEARYSNGTRFDPASSPALIVNEENIATPFSIPSRLSLFLVNLGSNTFKRRCGTNVLKVTALMVFDERRRRLHEANRLVTTDSVGCSPQIGPGESAELRNESLILTGNVYGHATLRVIVDPLEESSDANPANNALAIALVLPPLKPDMGPKCSQVSDAIGSQAMLTHRDLEATAHYFRFTSEMFEAELFQMNNKSEAMTVADRMFDEHWIVQVMRDQLEQRGECVTSEQRQPFVATFLRFLLDLRYYAATIRNVQTDWQLEQQATLVRFLRVVRTTLRLVLDGPLNVYFEQVAKLIRTVVLADDIPDFRSIGSIVNDILTQEPPKLESSSLIPVRLRIFMQRLANGIDKVTSTIPKFESDQDMRFLNEARQVLIELAAGKLWTFVLPESVSQKLDDLLTCDRDLVLRSVEALRKEFVRSLTNVSSPKEKESLELMRSFLARFSESGAFVTWAELVQTWSAIVYDERDDNGWHFLSGIPGVETDSSASFCVLQAIEELRTLGSEFSGDLPERLPPVVLYRTDKYFISRGDWDVITGRIFWTKIMACEPDNEWFARLNCTIESAFITNGTEVDYESESEHKEADGKEKDELDNSDN